MHSLNRLYLVGWDLLIKDLLNINTHSNSSAEATDPSRLTTWRDEIRHNWNREFLRWSIAHTWRWTTYMKVTTYTAHSSDLLVYHHHHRHKANDDTRAEEDASRSHIHHHLNRDWLRDASYTCQSCGYIENAFICLSISEKLSKNKRCIGPNLLFCSQSLYT